MSLPNNVNTFSGYLGSDFQLKLFWQILTEFEFGNKIFPNLEVSYFDDFTHKQYFIIIKNYYDNNERVPSIINKSIYEAIEDSNNNLNEITKETVIAITNKIINWNNMTLSGKIPFDGDVIQKNTFEFIKQQEYRKLASYIIEKTKDGEARTSSEIINNIEERVKKIGYLGADENDGVDIYTNIDSALEDDHRETIPTGIKVLDELMDGGLGRSEVGIILAGTGVGKSTLLTKIANTALNNGKNVLQIIFEDNERDIRRKHFSIWSKIKLSEIKNNKTYVKEKIVENLSRIKTVGGNLTIVKLPEDETTIIDVKNWIIRTQKKNGFKYDIITLDYIDCLEPHKKGMDVHQSELSIIKAFIAMADEFNIPMWTAIQGNRTGFSAEFLNTEHMGGNIKRAQKSHFLMSVAKSSQQKLSGTANISILKARFAGDGHQFKDCIFNNDTMEIRITDSSYTNTYSIPKHTKEELENVEKNNINLHSKISEKATEQTHGSILNDYKKMINSEEEKMNFNEIINEGLDDDDENLKNFLEQNAKNQGNIKKDEN